MLSLLQRSALPTLRARRAFSSASARLSSAAPADAAQPAPSSSAVSAAEAEAHAAALAHAKRELVATGYDADSLWEQRICWGDHDAFQHVNNCHYVRFIESARMRFAEVVARDLPPQRQADIVRGSGESMILGSISVRYRRPVVYPDTLLIGSAPDLPLGTDRFNLRAALYSLQQRAVVATAEQGCVSYDYRKLSKCELPKDFREALEGRGRKT